MDEQYLIQSAKEGNLDAFNTIILQYQDMVYNQAYRIMGEYHVASDATQDAFILAYRKIKSYRGGSFRAWILRIVTNVCYDEIRRQKRRPTVDLNPVSDDGEEIESPTWLEDPNDSPEERVQRHEIADAIQHCIDELSADYRTAVVLIDVQGLDYAEAAEVIGKPLGTVKSRLSRARERMRNCLQGFWELLPASMRLIEET